jgi:two-component system sensor histidine kinase KdpD
VFGRNVVAVGASEQAAYLAGVKTGRVKLMTYVLVGLFAGVAALGVAGRMNSVAASQVGQDEVRITAEVSGSLPQLRGDRKRLRQVLQNLVDNAIKYSGSGGEIRVQANAVDGSMRVDVSDDGPGVPFGDERVIFEKFGRASGSRGKPGTGLGLFISRSIVEAHGGSLELDRQPARGATFVLELPIGRD